MTALLLLAMPLAPFLAALVTPWAGRAGRPGWPAVVGVAIAFMCALAVPEGAAWHLSLGATAGRALGVGLGADALSRWMAVLVTAIAGPASVYATGYMAEEEGRVRFFVVWSFFVGAMLALVLSTTLLGLFAAWEAVGLASYGLIAHHHAEPEARDAATKAFLLTRLGDLGLLVGWLVAWRDVGTTDIAAVLTAAGSGAMPGAAVGAIALLCLAGAAGKSAQLPLSSWLPDAMAAPTPVSALLHSATMVAAGVYLVLRLYPLFAASPVALAALTWLGGATAVFAALTATAQHDLKRLLAWSTVSQLGEMLLALGLGGPQAAALHLTTHAAFKSTLFLAAGAVAQQAGARSLDALGGLARRMPVTAAAFAAAALALAGVPPLSGAFSEEAVMRQAVAHSPAWAAVMVALAGLAGVYVARAAWAAFGPWPGAPAPEARDPRAAMAGPLAGLAVAAVATGAIAAGRLGPFLGLPEAPPVGWGWRLAPAVAAGVGLAFGAWRVRSAGPVAAIGGWAEALDRGLAEATRWPVRLAFAIARGVEAVERGLDAAARALGRAARGLGGATARPEGALDGLGLAIARSTLGAAAGTARLDEAGFAGGGDALARGLGRAGRGLGRLQTGRIYMYVLGIVVWVLAAGAIGLFMRP